MISAEWKCDSCAKNEIFGTVCVRRRETGRVFTTFLCELCFRDIIVCIPQAQGILPLKAEDVDPDLQALRS